MPLFPPEALLMPSKKLYLNQFTCAIVETPSLICLLAPLRLLEVPIPNAEPEIGFGILTNELNISQILVFIFVRVYVPVFIFI
ncbi:uncharacterized protein N7446_004504 [Penicillium canescens]|uniref:Uncharacterized protein n=1 Tax=Penicillium canescens TaxID=5083 RepID=A0AAD6N324_PENCN|nr:uncharacterized protein N7446_004504 [Penicillium canescens]KAJ6026894.1 hypothetical protein N7460_011711 [Penicillium canescens]KAJ6040177.1 hypothetical protein N7444_009082 [Penicillium canescens]KAJ6067467.1 hypothetical protein N7446_004504 [Penicillium canescens]